MEVTLLGIVTLVRPEQYPNAPPPIEVTLFGIVMLVRPEQPLNALSPIPVTGRLSYFCGIIIFASV